MERNKKLHKRQSDILRVQQDESQLIQNLDNSGTMKRAKRRSFLPNLQHLNNFKSIHNSRDVRCMHKDEKLYQDEKMSTFDQKIRRKMRVNKSMKNLDELYRQFDKSQHQDGMEEQKKELEYAMCLNHKIKKEERNEVLDLHKWEDKCFQYRQKHTMSIPDKDLLLNSINNIAMIKRANSYVDDIKESEEPSKKNASDDNFKRDILVRKRSIMGSDQLVLQQNVDEEIEEQIEQYNEKYRKLKETRTNAIKKSKQIEKLNSNLLTAYNKYLHFLNIRCMKNSQMVSNFNKENINIQKILKILVDFVNKLKMVVNEAAADKSNWGAVKRVFSPVKRNRLSMVDYTNMNNSSNKRKSTQSISPNPKFLNLVQITKQPSGTSLKRMSSLNRKLESDYLLKVAIQQQDKEEKLVQKEKDLEQFKKKLNYNKQVIRMQNIDIALLKNKINIYENKRIEFLKSILKKGEDCREGIHWVVFSLFQKGEKVEEDMFPEWLDEKAQKFIMQRFEMEHQIEQMKEIQIFILNLYKNNKQTQEISRQVQQSMLQKQVNANNNNISIIDNSHQNIVGRTFNENVSYDSQFDNENASILSQISEKMNRRSVVDLFNNSTNNMLQVYKHVRLSNLRTKDDAQQILEIEQKGDKQYQILKQAIYRDCVNDNNNNNKSVNRLVYEKTQKRMKEFVFKREDKKRGIHKWGFLKQILSSRIDSSYQEESSSAEQLQQQENSRLVNLSNITNLLSNLSSRNDDSVPKNNQSNEEVFQKQKIVMFENDNQINDYRNRQDYVAQYMKQNEEFKNLQDKYNQFMKSEFERIQEEFKKGYGDRYCQNAFTVVSAIFGIKFALIKKYKFDDPFKQY